MKSWGKHAIINAHKCGLLYINNLRAISGFNDRLLDAIAMKPYGKPFIERFGEGHLKGYTLIQPIHTSSIVFHFAEESGDVYGDVFSCAWFDEAVVKAVIQDQFNPTYVDVKVLERQAGRLM